MNFFTQHLEAAAMLVFVLVFFGAWVLFLFGIWKTRKTNGCRSEQEFESEYEARNRLPAYCPNCGYDLRATPRRCPECGTRFVDREEYLRRLREEWPSHPLQLRPPGPLEKSCMLASVYDWAEASLIQEQLLARGMRCSIKDAVPSGEFHHGAVHCDVVVYSGDLELARAMLAAAKAPVRQETSDLPKIT